MSGCQCVNGNLEIDANTVMVLIKRTLQDTSWMTLVERAFYQKAAHVFMEERVIVKEKRGLKIVTLASVTLGYGTAQKNNVHHNAESMVQAMLLHMMDLTI